MRSLFSCKGTKKKCITAILSEIFEILFVFLLLRVLIFPRFLLTLRRFCTKETAFLHKRDVSFCVIR